MLFKIMEIKSNKSFLVWISSWSPLPYDSSWGFFLLIVHYLSPLLTSLMPATLLPHSVSLATILSHKAFICKINFLLSSIAVFKTNLKPRQTKPLLQAPRSRPHKGPSALEYLPWKFPGCLLVAATGWGHQLLSGRATPGTDQKWIFFLLFSLFSRIPILSIGVGVW